MLPIVTPEEMRAIDASAAVEVDVLIARAGAAVARAAVGLLDGSYGRRVVVIAGKGNNGADGRDAARRLRARGAHVDVLDAAALPPSLPRCDLVIDAAYGTGFRGTWEPPDVAGVPVLAVDIPSGADGSTGQAEGHVLWADRTVTFAALKPGLLFADGAAHAGEIEVVDIGLDTSGASAWLVEADDVADWLPERAADAHKYHSAAWVIAGSPGMTGAARLAASAAQRAGAGYVRLSTPGGEADAPVEVVRTPLPAERWSSKVLGDLERFKAVAVGPGLGRGSDDDVRALVRECPVPLVVDGDGLTAVGADLHGLVAHAVLTPHDGEYARLMGEPPGDDRIAAARALAERAGVTVVLKGEAMVVAAPDGEVLVAAEGDARLASAGTGDVLTGITVALLAQGLEPLLAAASAAFLLGAASELGWRRGLVASDVVALLPVVLEGLVS
jgi:hydroxyethylthiazole kinase-like uncharacterized protein yjeF